MVGPGIVGMPMAAMLAHARILEGSTDAGQGRRRAAQLAHLGLEGGGDQRGRARRSAASSPTSTGWWRSRSRRGLLSASHDYEALADADVILISVQTDKKGAEPDYGPLFEALDGHRARAAEAAGGQRAGDRLRVDAGAVLHGHGDHAITSRSTASIEGRDILLGNSPNRVMPGRLVERVAASDKIVAGLHPETPGLIRRIYARIVTKGKLHATNSMTAEVVKTLENAYRDVRIAYAAEVVRYCDEHDIDFFALRDAVNALAKQQDTASSDPQAVPSGGLLVPMLGVGGHCLPKDGMLLWWRALEAGEDNSRSA